MLLSIATHFDDTVFWLSKRPKGVYSAAKRLSTCCQSCVAELSQLYY